MTKEQAIERISTVQTLKSEVMKMIAIKDMEMPKSCGECNCSGTDVCKKWVYLNGYDLGKKRADDCPLVEVEECKVSKWIVKDGKKQGYDIAGIKTWYIQIVCNECGFTETAIEGHTGQLKYCPCCGAEMRGVKDE